jgi:hypothetical protein
VIPLRKIYSPEEEQERADKALRLNGVGVDIFTALGSDYDYNPKLLAAPSSSSPSLTTPIKPTLRVKRLDFRPTEEREKEKAEKALLLNSG